MDGVFVHVGLQPRTNIIYFRRQRCLAMVSSCSQLIAMSGDGRCGSVPYCKHRQDMNVMYKILEGPPQRKDYPKFDKYIHKPGNMWELLEKCWANEPESRPTMDEVVVALKAIARMPE
ncbi:protein tyrosine kinase domain-containing protein [Rhizoctonia solani AG-1 IA]|uniref:Protein tyrosine kinase domain-containing protein n=1 Tax=Thanatephorus cucumeris (strain AG1-IA) TaxID=983506 RepID=L8WH15_THACA|nr:protein tyrosine kinase domain-containing protein [Rhizoctonia solani AG-1 IA]